MSEFETWLNSDNVIKTGEDEYRTQCTQYAKAMTKKDLEVYFKKEYLSN